MLDKINTLPRPFRILLAIVAIAIAGVAYWVSAPGLRIYRANLRELKSVLSPWEVGGSEERVLVVAPHCDDEALTCSGVIHDTLARGGHVRVVVVTNGDGFYEIVRRLKRAGPRSYVELGEKRQKETLAAMRLLGLKDEDVIFLGYPDRGTSGMWLDNWAPDRPYRSHFTKCTSSPYKNSYRREAPYCGRALLADLESVILSFRPTTIYYPHPSDLHSDHWTVNCFVTQALYELNALHRVRTGLYLVHRGDKGDWPIPQGLHPSQPMAPPAYLGDIGLHWYEYPLSKEDTVLKLKAIHAYRSQLPFLGEFLYSFDRRNEMFGVIRPGDVPHMKHVFGDSEQIWDRVPPCIVDPVGDSIRVNALRGGDIRYVRCYFDDRNLYVRIELAHANSRRMSYSVSVCGLPDATAQRLTVFAHGKSRVSADESVKLGGNTVDMTVPLSRLGKWEALMVCADASMDKRKVDRTAWRLLMREDEDPKNLPNPPPVPDRPDLRTPLAPAHKPL
jgi:LmbE family N-acetylglucosaminyl deacetylase